MALKQNKMNEEAKKQFTVYEENEISLVSKDGLLLQYTYNQTPSICMAAVGSNNEALKYVKNKDLRVLLKIALGIEDV